MIPAFRFHHSSIRPNSLTFSAHFIMISSLFLTRKPL
jgi:hypothetical protein